MVLMIRLPTDTSVGTNNRSINHILGEFFVKETILIKYPFYSINGYFYKNNK